MMIDIWYGNHQRFGHIGLAQRWINILGRVRSPHPVTNLSYRLNGEQPVSLSVGPDHRRLTARGDFNIDIDHRKLLVGSNRLEISAADSAGLQATEELLLDFVPSVENEPITRRIEWSRVQTIQDVAQVIDGLWSLDGGVLSPVETGYDRLVGIGCMGWRDYEVTVPITLHGIDAACYLDPSIHAGVGIVLRWRGHTNWNTDWWTWGQPYCGPAQYGAIGWYCVFHETGPELNFFDTEFKRPVRKATRLALHQPYWFKARTQTIDVDTQFSLKVWAQGQAEPESWDLQTLGTAFSLSQGSFLLASHHVACSFGDVTVAAL